jgi:hypothetical protein
VGGITTLEMKIMRYNGEKKKIYRIEESRGKPCILVTGFLTRILRTHGEKGISSTNYTGTIRSQLTKALELTAKTIKLLEENRSKSCYFR